MDKFPDNVASGKAWCDVFFSFGLTIGPPIGTLLYTQVGFYMPFAITGSGIILSGVVALLFIEVFGRFLLAILSIPLHCHI